MIKARGHTKTPLLANGWPHVRLTLACDEALIGAGLRRFGPKQGMALAAGRVPDRLQKPYLNRVQSRPRHRGTASVFENAREVRGGLMGNSATVSAGQEEQ